MKRCERCKTGKLEKTVAPDSVEVGTHVFTAKVPALKCRECGEIYFDGPSLELAELLAVTPETVSRWETGKQPMEHRAMAVVGALVAERFEGRTSTLDNLKALRSPKKLERKIELSLAELNAP